MRIQIQIQILALLSLSGIMLAVAGKAEAQVVPSPFEFLDTSHDAGAYVGYATANRGQLDIGPGGGLIFGARYGIHLGGPFALEANTFFLPTDRNVYEPTLENGSLVYRGNTDALVAGVDGRLRFSLTGHRTWNRLAPYLAAGGGLVSDLSGITELEDGLESSERFQFGPSFLAVLGGGTRWMPTERTAVRVETTWNLWRLGTPAEFTPLASSEFRVPDREWVGVGALILGISYRF